MNSEYLKKMAEDYHRLLAEAEPLKGEERIRRKRDADRLARNYNIMKPFWKRKLPRVRHMG